MSMTPNGQAPMQSRQPLQTSDWMTTVSNSVRTIAPVGQTSRQPARTQCLHTSDENNQPNGCSRSMNATWRQVEAPSATVLSYEWPLSRKPSSGNWFHCLQATSHALQPMHTLVSVKKPRRLICDSGCGGPARSIRDRKSVV